MKAVAVAHPNIALVKYWGKRELSLNLPAVSSVSMTLRHFRTRTVVDWGTQEDRLRVNGEEVRGVAAGRVLAFLDLVDPRRPPVHVETENNFPTGAGLASSASGFAALALAARAASGGSLDLSSVSRLARRGSGSACRSLWGGFVHWDRGEAADGSDSFGRPLVSATDWKLSMVVAVVSSAPKAISSRVGMERTRATSPYYAQWVETAEADVQDGLKAIAARDLPRLGRVMEASTMKMHATMHTAIPPVLYWQPATVACLHAVAALRERGVGAWATMDAGPNVKVLCRQEEASTVADALRPIAPPQVLEVGGDPTVTVEQ